MYIYHHHQVTLLARISLTSFSLFDPIIHRSRPCEGVHKRKLLMNSSLLLQQCPACLVCLIWIVCKIGGSWLYNCCFLGCCLQDLFNIARSIFVQFPSRFFFLYPFSASMWCIHTVNLTQTFLERNSILFYQIGHPYDQYPINNSSCLC